jgi:hypothetical protein
MQKIEDGDFTHDVLTEDLIRYQLFPMAARFLAHNSIPTAYRGQGCAGIAFGENARALPKAAFEKPLILDAHAARILTEQGIDVGVEAFGDRFTPQGERFLRTGEFEMITDPRKKPAFASALQLRSGAKVESVWEKPDGTTVPASFSYENVAGQRFLVLGLDALTCEGTVYKNYSRQQQFLTFFRENAVALPAVCPGNPELYVLCKENESTLCVGLFNCFADAIDGVSVQISQAFREAEFGRCAGTLQGDVLKIDHLAAFDWCFVKLCR